MPRLPLTILACFSLALGGAFVAGCGGDDKDSDSSAQTTPKAAPEATSSEDTGGTSASEPVLVSMESSKFDPEKISVKVGQMIIWTNKDGYAHNVTSRSGEEIESGNIEGSKTFEFTPKKAGAIAYTCTLHADQDGSIAVAK